jgi:hypothetical protein
MAASHPSEHHLWQDAFTGDFRVTDHLALPNSWHPSPARRRSHRAGSLRSHRPVSTPTDKRLHSSPARQPGTRGPLRPIAGIDRSKVSSFLLNQYSTCEVNCEQHSRLSRLPIGNRANLPIKKRDRAHYEVARRNSHTESHTNENGSRTKTRNPLIFLVGREGLEPSTS